MTAYAQRDIVECGGMQKRREPVGRENNFYLNTQSTKLRNLLLHQSILNASSKRFFSIAVDCDLIK